MTICFYGNSFLGYSELQMMMMLAQMDPAILEQFRAGSNLIAKELERMKKSEELQVKGLS